MTSRKKQKTIRFRGKTELIKETLRLRGRTYFVLETLSPRGAFRVFDPNAGPRGDYRVLYHVKKSLDARQKLETLRRMTGPTANRNFPQIVDFVRQADRFSVVFTWVWGPSLEQFCFDVDRRNVPRPSTTEAVRLFRGLAHGLSHFHRRCHTVHGDVGPRNIIVTNRSKQLVLIDFGSAWPVEKSAERSDGDGVTLPYAAPERIFHHALEDWRSDQFSLASVAYELLTGQVPFDGLGGQAFQRGRGIAARLTPPSRLIADAKRLPREVTRRLDSLLKKSLSLHPEQRFPTRKAWLDSWDRLHDSIRRQSRLSRFEATLLQLLEGARKFCQPNER